jgi:hypothetical protein
MFQNDKGQHVTFMQSKSMLGAPLPSLFKSYLYECDVSQNVTFINGSPIKCLLSIRCCIFAVVALDLLPCYSVTCAYSMIMTESRRVPFVKQ